MAAIDPYSPCPCGSGQKFKWCCYKVEAYAERAQRLFDNGQLDAAVKTLRDGLEKEPGNSWLRMSLAFHHVNTHDFDQAKESVRLVLATHPQHLTAHSLAVRLELETEGAEAGAAQLQQALTSVPRESRAELTPLVRMVAAFFTEEREFPAALSHLALARRFESDGPNKSDTALETAIRSIERSAAVTPWEKNPDRLVGPPEGVSPAIRKRFTEALEWAEQGLWSSAAAAFETLSSDPTAGPVASRNLGFCRLWLGDATAGVSALRRYAARLGVTTEAVDLEALCQEMSTSSPDELVDHVQLIWPLRKREALVAALGNDKSVRGGPKRPIDPTNSESPEADQYTLLDRPPLEKGRPELTAADVPIVVGSVLVGQEIVALETYDDGRLDALSDRFTSLAGSTIPPAHPKTKVLEKVSRLQLALTWDRLIPEGVDPSHALRLTAERGAWAIRERWPETRMGFLHGRTPLQAARAGDAVVPLRAAVLRLEQMREPWRAGFDFVGLRSRLRIEPEPTIDPATVDVESLHLSRLALVPAQKLEDGKLVELYLRARKYSIGQAIENAAIELVGRHQALARFNVEGMTVYSDLATLASSSGRHSEGLEWIRRGMQAEAPADRARNAAAWDVLELRLETAHEPPELWVPNLAMLLERHGRDAAASRLITLNLIDMGLVEVVPDPNEEGRHALDTRVLQAMLARYGPRVTTASGRVGASAAKPEIWTPGAEGGAAGGGIWTPGGATATPPPGGEKKLIIPGR